MLKTNETISPHFLYRKTKINIQLIKDLLIDLSFECPLLGTKYILFCNNEDSDMIHGFEFTSMKEVKEFILSNGKGKKCPECDSALKLDDIRVCFYKKKAYAKVM